jgi:hypothetical protein
VSVVAGVEGASTSEVHYVDKIGLFLRNADPLWDPGEPAAGSSVVYDDPVASFMGDANSAGVSDSVARADHVHDRQDDAALFWMSAI